MLVDATARSLVIAYFYKCLHARFLIKGGSFLKMLVARRLTFVKARAWKTLCSHARREHSITLQVMIMAAMS